MLTALIFLSFKLFCHHRHQKYKHSFFEKQSPLPFKQQNRVFSVDCGPHHSITLFYATHHHLTPKLLFLFWQDLEMLMAGGCCTLLQSWSVWTSGGEAAAGWHFALENMPWLTRHVRTPLTSVAIRREILSKVQLLRDSRLASFFQCCCCSLCRLDYIKWHFSFFFKSESLPTPRTAHTAVGKM